jgi:hypothetical protein
MTKNKIFLILVILSALTFILISGCTEKELVEIGGATQDEACSIVSDCEAGLTCENDVCVPVEPLATGPKRGDECDSNADCAPDLFCGTQGVCTYSEGFDEGTPCGLTIDCKDGLVCHGNSLTCVDPSDYPEGTGIKDFGESCSSFTDCRRPYLCSMASPASAVCDKIPFFPGPDCSRTDAEAGAFRVYFEIPPETIPDDEPFEFYRLPFPNDIRMKDGHISLSGHPSPGEVMGIDVAGEYLGVVEEDADGFAINGPIFFRLTDFPQESSIVENVSVYLVNIDQNSPDYNKHHPVQLALGKERGQYICQYSIGIGPLDGEPLDANTTYAAIVTTDIRDIRNDPPIQDRDFVRILSADETLSDHVLEKTEPLRAWILDQSIDENTIAAAAVFTTGNPSSIGQDLYDAVMAMPAPNFNDDAFDCANPPASTPACHGLPTQDRGCGNPTNAYEIHGTYDGPVFQNGTRPYVTSDYGGGMNFDDNGKPIKAGTEAMCYALTIPSNLSMPPTGWPVVIYAHGTGANYRTFVEKSIISGHARSPARSIR